MTDRGLPIVDGAPACPFVAFEEDRDARATSPDHRHRCYAEVRPAPRALAHQEAYCLSSSFPVCPTFQDWARREAATAKAGGSPAASAGGDDAATGAAGSGAGSVGGAEAGAAVAAGAGSGSPGFGERNPPRNWAAPPPWMGARDEDGGDDEREVVAQPPVHGSGLAGSFADRLAGGSAPRPAPPAPPPRDDPEPDDDRVVTPALPGPSWERPRRMEAYPTLKTRMGLPSISLPPLLVAVAAVVIAAVALFFLPALLGIGNPPGTGVGTTPTAGASTQASGSLAPATPTPGPTQQIYVVQAGDTMSRIADRFGVPLDALIEANRETVPNPDLVEIGQEIIIPTVAPTSLPDAGASPSPS